MSWIKGIGLILVFVCCVGGGVYGSNRLHRRARFLETVEKWCAYTAAQIRYTAAPIRDIWQSAARRPEFESLVFLEGAQDTEWKEHIYRLLSVDACTWELSSEDMALILEWIGGIGNSDLDGQLTHCVRYGERFAEQYRAAKEKAAGTGRLYISLGVLGGIAAVLLLL